MTDTTVAAPDWWAVRRFDDDRYPEVWWREPLAALVVEADALVPIVADGSRSPLRQAELDRDGDDYLQRGDAFPTCTCETPTAHSSDDTWCTLCASVVRR